MQPGCTRGDAWRCMVMHNGAWPYVVLEVPVQPEGAWGSGSQLRVGGAWCFGRGSRTSVTWGAPRPLAPLPRTSLLFLRLKFHRPLGLGAGCAGRLQEENYSDHPVTHQLRGAHPAVHPTPSPCMHSLLPTASQLTQVSNEAAGGAGGPQHCCETPRLGEQRRPQQPVSPPKCRHCGQSGNTPQEPHRLSAEQ